MIAAPASSTAVGVCPSAIHAVAIPTGGTSRVIGATREAGCRRSSQVHAPNPKPVETITTYSSASTPPGRNVANAAPIS